MESTISQKAEIIKVKTVCDKKNYIYGKIYIVSLPFGELCVASEEIWRENNASREILYLFIILNELNENKVMQQLCTAFCSALNEISCGQ